MLNTSNTTTCIQYIVVIAHALLQAMPQCLHDIIKLPLESLRKFQLRKMPAFDYKVDFTATEACS